jgi:hypothetical protein
MKQDKLSQLIEKGDEEALLKLLRGWNYAQEREKGLEFLDYNQTGLDERHSGNFYKLDDTFRDVSRQSEGRSNKLENMEVLTG